MSALRLPWVLSQISATLRRRSSSVPPRATAMLVQQRPLCHSLWHGSSAVCLRNIAAFSTHTSETGGSGLGAEPSVEKPKKSKDPHARKTIGSVGRKIHHRHLLLLSATGESLGTHHRADVIRMMEEKQMKLVAVNENADPPVFRLMTGKQIHEEQMKLREKTKNQPGPVKVKELTFSSDIAAGDLRTKLRQVTSWLEKKHHIRVTLRASHYGSADETQPLDKALEVMLSKMDVAFGYVSPSRSVRDGRAASCIIRPPTNKEMRAAMATAASSESSAPSKDTPPPTPAAKEGSVEKEAEPN
ncbi:hypothetical protein ACEWY4_016990 [Coilia grayii]|uniref:Translation initiation factor 3 N-terminal domain-containing protein n=1 Tax=Coilia grayii TaxID=363190 RepID=A0ABD1JLZ9_9TELE